MHVCSDIYVLDKETPIFLIDAEAPHMAFSFAKKRLAEELTCFCSFRETKLYNHIHILFGNELPMI
jgi:hypothetical protein